MMQPYAGYALQQPQVLTLPRWARVFRTILLILGGVLAILSIVLVYSATTSSNLTNERDISTIQLAIYLSLIILALSGPYLIGSITYGVLWAASLRGKGYRAYPGTTWILLAAPVIVGLVFVTGVALLFGPPSMF